MTKFEKTCKTCNYCCCKDWLEPCFSCKDYSLWECPDWLTYWLNSFDTSSATECYTAVNLFKQTIDEPKEG